MTQAILDQTALYRFFDADGVLLYVGITGNPRARFEQHRQDSAWWPHVDHGRTVVEWHGSRPEAARLEMEAIRSELPTCNISGTPRQVFKGPKYVPSPSDVARAERVAELYRAWRRAEEEYKQELARTAKPDGPVSVTYLADVIGVTRKTVYRHLGRSMT